MEHFAIYLLEMCNPSTFNSQANHFHSALNINTKISKQNQTDTSMQLEQHTPQLVRLIGLMFGCCHAIDAIALKYSFDYTHERNKLIYDS